jgi:hypothetical protein
MPEPDATTAVADAQMSEINAYEATLHGHPPAAWQPYRAMQAAAAGLPSIAEQRTAAITALLADDKLPIEHRRVEAERLRVAADQEVADLRNQALVATARLEAHLRGALLPVADGNPAMRTLHRQDLAAAFEGVDPGRRLGVAEQIVLTAPPGQVAELLSPYGRGLVGAANAEMLDKTAVGWLRRRGGTDAASTAAVHALDQFEKRKLVGRVDAQYQVALLKLNTGRR